MTKRLSRFVLLLFAVITNTQCKMDQSPSLVEVETKASIPVKQDSLIEPLTIEYAKNFSVSNFENYKIARLRFRSENRNIIFDQKIIFLQKGTSRPDLSGELANA